MGPTFKIYDQVYFIHHNQIKTGKITQILITATNIYYDILYRDINESPESVRRDQKDTYIDIDTLIFNIKFNFEYKGETI